MRKKVKGSMMCRISKVVCLSVGDKRRSWGRRGGRGDEEVEEKGEEEREGQSWMGRKRR